ncbi:MAG TPA: hybrid sensor histidine kinase/response regulator [Thermoanaerobaculia bacterium]|nr:hybrid sensor histidine kinase/response regulator [Thermoanaerobaculia bacterium]
MAAGRDEFLKKLLATFRVEAGEHLEAMGSGLLSLERTTGAERTEILERIFREAHSLKGAARAVSLGDVERLCHSLESLFGGWKANRVAISAASFDLVHEALDLLAQLVSADAAARTTSPRLDGLIRKLDEARRADVSSAEGGGRDVRPPLASEAARSTPSAEAPALASLAAGTIRVQTAKLDSIMRETEELLGPRLAAAQRVLELRETRTLLENWRKHKEGGRPVRRFWADETSALLEQRELSETDSVFFKSLDARLAKLEKNACADQRALAGIVDNLLHDVKESQMLPFASLAEGLRKLVRDLARDHGKDVELVVHGSDIAVDRRILEEMKAPLQHLLRNAIDHGIESPRVREEKRKPPQGTITVAVSQRDNRIEIATSDDGTGIDLSAIRAAARKLGLLAGEDIDALSENDLLSLIFQSGLSTSPMITEISGRGLGLAIVREKVDGLGGRIAVETHRDAGTTIRVDLPLTLATFRGVLVAIGERRFMIPASSVERVTRAAVAEIRTVENRETISLDGRTVSLVRLSDVLELPRSSAAPAGYTQAVVLGTGLDRIAFCVDAVLSEQEVLVRSLGPQLARVRNVAGASVLGTGEVVPVLNVPDLMKSAARPAVQPSRTSEIAAEAEQQSILVVEDSITSRTLLKSILEAAGYSVATAVDGIDAYTQLKTHPFDLIVSDIEMPRMDGFDLTAKVRADPSLADTPVVLVTALASREHRERGIDAGANAYIVKSDFDQSNLLEVIRQLL